MRKEEAIVGDEETPPDRLRCHRNTGRAGRCKRWKFDPRVSFYCEYHYNQRLRYKEKEREKKKNKATNIEQQQHHHHHHQVIEKKLVSNQRLGKRRRCTDFFVSSSTDDDNVEEDDNFILAKKNRISTKASDSKEMEKYSISELIIYLKSSFRKQEFENVEKILRMREDKVKMEKQEAENRTAQFQKELGILGATCEQLTSEVEEKKKAIFEVNDSLMEMEIKNLDIQDELERCNRKKDDLEAKVGCLEKKLEIVRERERRSEERFTKMSWDLRERLRELERKNRDLETDKRRGECGIDVCKKRLDPSETQVLIESHASRARVPEEAKKCENKQTKTQSGTGCELNGAHSPNLKGVLNCGGRIYASAEVDLDCCSPSGTNRVTQFAGVRKESESKQIKFQTEATQAMKGATLSQINIKEEAFNCNERFYTSASGDSVHHSTRGENANKSTPSKQKSTSLQQSNESESTQTKFQTKASCALIGVKLSQVKAKEEPLNCDERFSASARVDSAGHSIRGDNIKDASISRSRSNLLQQFEQKRSGAEQILPDQFEVIGTSGKQSRNSTAENDSVKDAKELGADCGGISAFLCDLRRLKANKPNSTLKRL